MEKMETYQNTEKKLTQEEILQFENAIGLPLPKEFIDFYLVNNGGYPPYNFVSGDEYLYSIDGFISIKYGQLSIEKLLKDYEGQGVVFKEKIPFASDSAGNIFFLFLDNQKNGEIYLWQSDSKDNSNDSFSYVTDSFKSFLEGMTNDEEEEDDNE
jgi:SMI1 / KNR4 family (SUKH-1)